MKKQEKRAWFVNPVESKMHKKKKAKKKSHPKRRNPGKAKQLGLFTAKKPAKKRKKAHGKVVYRTVKTGGQMRRTGAVNRGKSVYKNKKGGKKRRVIRVNPGLPGPVKTGLAVLGGVLVGVGLRVGAHLAAPGNATAQKAVAAIGFVGGLIAAAKMKSPAFGVAVATAAADGGVQNDAVFRTEMMLAPANPPATTKGLGAITYDSMGNVVNVRQLPAHARINGVGELPAYARNPIRTMRAIVADNMGSITYDNMAALKTQNPFQQH